MRINGTLFVVFTLLAVFWGVKLMFGLFVSAPVSTGGGGSAMPTREDKIQALLSGEFKRQPKKNPVEGTGLLRCAIRDAQGAVASAATVRVTPCDPENNPLEAEAEYRHYWEETSSVSGLVEFRTLPAGDFLLLASLDGSHGLARVAVVEGGAFAEAQIALWPAEPRHGEVSAGGRPLAGARIVPVYAEDSPADTSLYRHLPVITGPDGAFEHPLLPAGAWQLLVSAPGRAPKLVQAGEDGVFRAALDPGEKLAGRVVRDGGERPVNNAKVELQARDRAGEFYSVRANGQGYFTFDRLRPATYQLRLAPGELKADLEVVVSPGSQEAQSAATPLSRNMKIDPLTGAAVATDASVAPAPSPAPTPKAPPALQLVARAAGSMRGRVLEAGAEVGVPGVEIGLYPAETARPVAVAISDQAGYYQLKSLTPGSYRLAATRAGGRVFVTGSGSDVVIGEGSQQPGPILREASPVSLAGQVLDGNGKPVPEANIVVAVAGYPGGVLTFGSDRAGQFLAGGLLGEDLVELWAVRIGLESAHFGPVSIGGTGLQDIQLRFPAP